MHTKEETSSLVAVLAKHGLHIYTHILLWASNISSSSQEALSLLRCFEAQSAAPVLDLRP
jgi:hypothetical protein